VHLFFHDSERVGFF